MPTPLPVPRGDSRGRDQRRGEGGAKQRQRVLSEPPVGVAGRGWGGQRWAPALDPGVGAQHRPPPCQAQEVPPAPSARGPQPPLLHRRREEGP